MPKAKTIEEKPKVVKAIKATNTKAKSRAFNLLERGATIVAASKEALTRSGSNLRHNVQLSNSQENRILIPIRDFVYQRTLNLKGFISGTVYDMLGAEGIGKTTLGFTIMGGGMTVNCPCLYVSTEGKDPTRDRVERCLHPKKDLARQLYDTITMEKAFEIREAVRKIHEWMMLIRKEGTPAYVSSHIPGIVFLDTFSKLMPPDEAAAFEAYMTQEIEDKKTGKKKKPVTEMGKGSNFVHAKMAQQWTRVLPHLLSYYNILFIVGRHQNMKVDMHAKPGGGSFISPEDSNKVNDTSIGGKAFAQAAAYRTISTSRGFESSTVDGVKTKVQQLVTMMIKKNTFGRNLASEYAINQVFRHDTEETHEPCITFDHYLAPMLFESKLLTMAKGSTKNKFSCKEINAFDADPYDFAQKFYAHPEIIQTLGFQMGIHGYGPHFVVPTLNPEIAEASGLSPDPTPLDMVTTELPPPEVILDPTAPEVGEENAEESEETHEQNQ